MIKSLSIKNYQSHHNSEFTFHEGVNVVIGSSDSGKTAIIRALRWIINNSPSGDSFRTYGSKETDIILKTFDNDLILKTKSNSKNEYKIRYNNRHSEPEIFKAFGQGIPKEIQHLLNINNINFQYQLDSPFLLSSSSGEVARILNNTVNLDIIDQCLSSIAKRSRDTQRQLDYETNQLKDLEEKCQQYNYLEHMEKDIIELEEKNSEYDLNSTNHTTLYNSILNYEKLSSEAVRISNFLKIEPYALDLEKKAVTSDSTQQKHTNLSLLIEDIQDLSDKKAEIEKVLEAEDEIIKLQGIENKVNEMEDNLLQIDKLIDLIQDTETNLSNTGGELKFCQNEFNRLMPEICPLCNK
jgi:exonuclease SbcC